MWKTIIAKIFLHSEFKITFAAMNIFTTGFIQVFFVSIQTYLISKELYPGVFMVGFAISFVWSFNVKKVAFGTMKDRVIYSFGAACGALVGLLLSVYVFKKFH
jgi:hypothetical protein